MAEALNPTLEKKQFHNWLKGAISVVFAKEGLSGFVQTEILDFQKDLINSFITQNGIPPGSLCGSCTTANLLSCPTTNFCSKGKRCNKHDKTVPDKTPNIQCRKNLCNGIKDWIRNQQRYNQPSWSNSDATKWCVDAFEVAKCFLPPDGYSSRSSLAETDFNGTISLIINNKRFQNKMTTQLNTQHNTCSTVRNIVNETIRHSGSNELTDTELAQCIDALRDVLSDSKFLLHDQHAQAAVNKLNQLQNNTLTISAGDITRALEENIRDCLSKQQLEAVQAIQKYLHTAQTASVAALEFIKSSALDEIRKTADDKKQELLQLSHQHHTHNYDVLLNNLKEDIITYYREHESVIPASPLVEEHNVPIEDLYVLPPIWAYKDSYFKPINNRQKGDETSGNDGQDKQKITISELLLSGDVRYRKIYITANAGFGKTSLSQKLTMTWCQSQSHLESLAENYGKAELTSEEAKFNSEEKELDSEETELDSEKNDIDSAEDELESEKAALDMLRYFDLLFLLHLRDYQCESMCNLDDLIIKMVLDKLSRNALYTKEFLQRCLHEKKCLIILDGLDEWAHPGHCTRKPEVPHNNHPDSCTVLTTTREWKIGTIGLSPKDIGRRVEISMLDDKAHNLLEKNAIGILNERNLNLAEKNIADFDKEVKKVQIGNIIYIPYILLQLMCVFFGGLPIGKSKCEIYSNITEFTLKRGLNKKDIPDMHVQSNENPPIPNCMKENETCTRYFILLMKLWKLAYYTLFSENKESSLIFDRRIVTQYITEQEIEFCLKVGLLCQTKDSSIIAVKRYQVFFQHKSVQEFFSALYISSEWQNESVKSTILNVCSSLSGILEMSNVFIFVCGIKPEVYTCISVELQKIVDLDDVTHQYRTNMYIDYDARETMESYQSLQVQCLQESVRNGHDSCSIHIHDYILTEEDLTTLKIIINFNKCNVKSLQLYSVSDKITAFMQSLDPGVFTSLETLTVVVCDKEHEWLADILTESARKLKCLTLSGCTRSLSAISITALTGLACLQSLYLRNVLTTHFNLKCLYAYISQTTTLTQLKLAYIDCSDHESQYRDCDVTLDLLLLNELKMLDLSYVPCTELNVNPTCLEKLEFVPKREIAASASATLWQDLRAAPVLSSLTLENMSSCQEMIQTIPTLTQLQHFELRWIDMGDVIPRVLPAMAQLERVELASIRMSSAAWRELFLSVGQLPRSITVKLSWITMTSQEWKELLLSVSGLQHPVTVMLYECKGPSKKKWQAIVNVIKATPTLSLLHDLSMFWWGASLTLKNKTM